MSAHALPAPTLERPRIGFLGVGWIGRTRMEAMAATGLIEVAAIADPAPENVLQAGLLAPGAARCEALDALLKQRLDGLVIATPSALHAEQSIRALEQGIPVFCQKPLGRNRAEVEGVIAAARAADRLLGVDLSYRGTAGMGAIRDLVRTGQLGHVHAVDLVFHNAFGPDKPWFYDPLLSGGGCMTDLGTHLVDLALWVLDFPEVEWVSADLFSKSRRLMDRKRQVEDYGIATVRLAGGTVMRIATSWHLHAGQDAIFSARFFGEKGGASFDNVGGSFYDFAATQFSGTTSQTMTIPGDPWGGQMAAAWARRLVHSPAFDPECESLAIVAGLLDSIYAAHA
ncbi:MULTISPECIES: Gfo/Idh/MocA family protein [Sphingobium]|uniref:Gfo/Idh/MocA family protein n=1 Tax=Sphingobium TaxID=165695 RepID=UPI001BE5AAD2|nr:MULTISPECIES: Gfo/Idh/MocA family oxidoreductase [Sphingobium]MBT2245055.1 Gfo/Idh/MocA family oxidoreductase [Sphingobium sp. BHU LFT2]WBQ19413.1 Gfo/Idh/MocA family oxidoreductase [Sphingobium yanoikuyae]